MKKWRMLFMKIKRPPELTKSECLVRSDDNNFPGLYKKLFVIEIQTEFSLTKS